MKKFFLALIIISFFASCKHQQKNIKKYDGSKPIILVSKDSKKTFQTWLQNASNEKKFECFNMYSIKEKNSINIMLKKTDGIIISGGEDVNPALYGKEYELERCGTITKYRDSLEQVMINYALENNIPLLGICRGHQIMNVSFGGSLIIDIPEDIGSESLHRNMGRTNHMIYIEKGSYLYNIVKVDSGIILSNHHQAVDKLASKYTISSYAIDKVAESIEPTDTLNHPFILGVQWHPEGMDVKNPLSGKIALKYLWKVKEQFEKN